MTAWLSPSLRMKSKNPIKTWKTPKTKEKRLNDQNSLEK
jgi:hypothetical protein